MAADIDTIISSSLARIRYFGDAAMRSLQDHMVNLAKQHTLLLKQIDFASPNLRLLPDSYGYGEEPVVHALSPFKVGIHGTGARVIYAAGLGDTLPVHDYLVGRMITPNVLVPPPAAAKLFGSDKLVADAFQSIERQFTDNVETAITRAKERVYGSVNVIPYDAIGSMTLVGSPELRSWTNLPGDLIGFRCDLYVGLTVIPGRAVSADTDVETPASEPDNKEGPHGDPAAYPN